MSTELRSDLAEIRRALMLLCEPGEVYEIRGLNTRKRTVSGYSNDIEKLASVAPRISDGLAAEGVYVTINPVLGALLARSANEATYFAKETTADHEILRRRWLLIDADPVRPRGISSTDAEHELALERARAIR